MDKKIRTLTTFVPEMFEGSSGPYISMYMPTHRSAPENEQDKIRFKTLLSEVEASLAEKHEKREYADTLALLKSLIDAPDTSLWRFAKDGLAVLAHKDAAYLYRLDYSVAERAIVADSYHIRPLIRNFQYGQRYYLLALSEDRFSVYKGDIHTLEKVSLPETIKTEFSELFDDFDNTSSTNVGSAGKNSPRYFGRGSKEETVKKETEKYFRYINQELTELFSQGEKCPLILVGLPQNQALFRGLSAIPCLIEEGIEKPYESMGESELITKAHEIVVAEQKAHIKKLLDDFGLAQAQERGSSDFSTIANALAERKVLTLFVERKRLIPGRFDATLGTVDFEAINSPDVDDIIDDFAQATYLQGGAVYILDKEDMPSTTGVAALFRY